MFRWLWFVGTLVAALPSAASDVDLSRCRAMVDPGARLTCYDNIPLQATTPGQGSLAGKAGAATTARQIETFGLPAARAAERQVALQTSIIGKFDGWEPRQQFKLANGQIWQLVDGSRGSYWLQDPAVRIEQGSLGGFVMHIEGVRQLLRVERVR